MNTTPPTNSIDDPVRCSRCGLSEAELRADGEMGCASCYTVFAPLVAQAVATLHGVPEPPSPLPPPRAPLPWPTRRAVATPAATDGSPTAPRERR